MDILKLQTQVCAFGAGCVDFDNSFQDQCRQVNLAPQFEFSSIYIEQG